jgi:outer membrane protein assembly factor BamB
VLGERVYVATVGNEVYALEASTGRVVWKKSVGTPVPSEKGSSELPCGDIEPTVGVVGTPVIDPSTETIYMVADTWDTATNEAHHMLKGLRLSDGEQVLSTNVDPPGADPKALLQRTALNLDGGNVIFGFGGNDGDCSDYRGAVVMAPLNGGKPRFWQYQPAPPSISGGAVWAPAGPAVDSAGYVYATTGNPDPPAGQTASTFDYSDSVVKLDPTKDFVENPTTELVSPLGWFEPPNWEEESNNDLDLSSAAAELLPGGLLFQAGKDGVGYLIDEATLDKGEAAVYHNKVCGENSGYGGSFGGDAFANGVIYIPCENGTQALAFDAHAGTFIPLWQGPSDAVGPPIVSAGLVWTVATGGFSGGGTTLYGLDPTTGAPRYTEILPSPVADHFASPSAAGGRLFLATGSSVTAYQIAQLYTTDSCVSGANAAVTQCPPISVGGASTNGGVSGASNVGALVSAPAIATKPLQSRLHVKLLRTHLHSSASGRVRVVMRCTSLSACRGTVTLQARLVSHAKRNHAGGRVYLVQLVRAHFGPTNDQIDLVLQLNKAARILLARHHGHLPLNVVIESQGNISLHVLATLT